MGVFKIGSKARVLFGSGFWFIVIEALLEQLEQRLLGCSQARSTSKFCKSDQKKNYSGSAFGINFIGGLVEREKFEINFSVFYFPIILSPLLNRCVKKTFAVDGCWMSSRKHLTPCSCQIATWQASLAWKRKRRGIQSIYWTTNSFWAQPTLASTARGSSGVWRILEPG